MSASALQDELKRLEARLKRADTLTRKSVTSLETIVTTLDARVSSNIDESQPKLAFQVKMLAARLDDQLAKTRALVRAELKDALSAGGLDTLAAALSSCRERVDAAELAQASAITKINRHLADMARAVDARIAQETADRTRDIAGVQDRLDAAQTEITERVDTVERDSADALTRVGDSIAEIHDRLETRRRHDSDDVTQKVNELALQTQAELDAYQSRLDARIAELEHSRPEPFVDVARLSADAAEQARAAVAQDIDALQRRIDELERDRQRAAADAAAVAASQAAAQAQAQSQAAYQAVSQPDATLSPQSRNESALVHQLHPAQPGATAAAADNPYAAKIPAEDRPDHMPLEFDPDAYAALTQAAPNQAAPNQTMTPQADIIAFSPAQAAPGQRPHAQSPHVQPPNIQPPHAQAPQSPHSPTARRPHTPPAMVPPALPPIDVLPPIETLRPSVSVPQPIAGPPPAPISLIAPASPPPPATPLMPSASSAPHPTIPPMEPDFESAPLPDIPFANPAYAEGGAPVTDGSPVAVRIGETGKSRRKPKTPKVPKLPKRAKERSKDRAIGGSGDGGMGGPLTGRNLKVAAMGVGVVVVGLVAARSILSTGGPIDAVERPAMNASNEGTAADQPYLMGESGSIEMDADGRTMDAQTTAPIGQYAEAELVEIDPSDLGTLDTAAAAGDPVAMAHKGLNLVDAGDMDAGIAMLRRAAQADQPAALYRLAKIYEDGDSLPKDEAMAQQLIERAARGGNRIAMHDLALYYYYGQGSTEQNLLTARSWFEQAATRGVVDSQFNLAVLYEKADSGLPVNPDEAMFWYSVAATQGDQFAVQRRDALAATLEPARLERVQERIRAFTPRPIDKVANGVFTGQPWTLNTAAKGNAPKGSDTVRNAQSLLASLGFEVGTPDGLMGKKTRTAIQAFERANGLPETGEVNVALIERLEVAAGA